MTHEDEKPTPRSAEHGGHARPVDCAQLVSLLGDYVDDHLPADQKAAVDGHIHQCGPCMAFLRQYRFAPQAVRAHLLEKVPVDLETRLLTFLRERTGKTRG
jgi:anti-sigma factor RsiW